MNRKEDLGSNKPNKCDRHKRGEDPPIGNIVMERLFSLTGGGCCNCRREAQYTLILWTDSSTKHTFPFCGDGIKSLCLPVAIRKAESTPGYERRNPPLKPEDFLLEIPTVIPRKPLTVVESGAPTCDLAMAAPRKPGLYGHTYKKKEVPVDKDMSDEGLDAAIEEMFVTTSRMNELLLDTHNLQRRRRKDGPSRTSISRSARPRFMEIKILIDSIIHAATTIAVFRGEVDFKETKWSKPTTQGFLDALKDMANWTLKNNQERTIAVVLANSAESAKHYTRPQEGVYPGGGSRYLACMSTQENRERAKGMAIDAATALVTGFKRLGFYAATKPTFHCLANSRTG